MWDIGGQRKIRPYWRNYFENTDVLVSINYLVIHFTCEQDGLELKYLIETGPEKDIFENTIVKIGNVITLCVICTPFPATCVKLI